MTQNTVLELFKKIKSPVLSENGLKWKHLWSLIIQLKPQIFQGFGS